MSDLDSLSLTSVNNISSKNLARELTLLIFPNNEQNVIGVMSHDTFTISLTVSEKNGR